MPVNKSNLPINFAKGLDLKTDPFQVGPGNFLKLENTIFTKAGLLAKRNGFAQLTPLPTSDYTYLTTFNTNLTAIGNNLSVYSTSNDSWVNKGALAPLSVNTQSLIKNALNQIQADSVIAPNGLICTAYTESNGSSTVGKFVITDSVTGQNIVAPTAIPVTSGTVSPGVRVFLMATRFVIVFTNVISGVAHLQYIIVNSANPTVVIPAAEIAAAYTATSRLSWDGVVVNGQLMIAYNTITGGQSVKVTYLNQSFQLAAPITFVASKATTMSLTTDVSNPTNALVYVSFHDSASTNGFTAIVTPTLSIILAPTQVITGKNVVNITSSAQNGIGTLFYEVANTYTYDTAISTNYVNTNTITQSGTVGTEVTSCRSLGLASKSFIMNGKIYYLGVQSSAYQPTYFIVNGSLSTSASPNIVAKLAYSNAGGYSLNGLPSVSINGTVASFPYFFKDLVQGINKLTNVPLGSSTNGIYSQTGVNFADINFTSSTLDTAEIGNNLHLSGGFLSMYDGYQPVEHGFHLWPENVESTSTVNAGGLTPQKYYYQAVYSWVDNQGNVFRSAPSLPNLLDLSQGNTITFNATIYAGSTSVTVSSSTGLYAGQPVTDLTTPGRIQPGTIIQAVSSTLINLSLPALSDSAAGGDTLSVPAAISFTAALTAGSKVIVASSTTGLYVGQTLTDTTTANNLTTNSYITGISGSNVTLNAPALVTAPNDNIASIGVYSATINVPTYRTTSKVSNPAKVEIYRWSTAQEVYYQVTSLTSPLLNDTTVDSVTFTDTLGDAAIVGNPILYTTGGVIENIGAPACSIMTLFDTRLWLVDAEDQNLLWFSKQVIEGTPVEMSDLFTMYIAPSVGSQGPTGPITALAVLDDKLIIFKKNAMYYVNGQGPDNTGTNNQYSQPVFITSTVGCTNQNSIVFQPNGLMFQSDKGIWLLDRNLNSTYLGAAVETLTTGATVQSALNIPGTNQVRFTLNTGITLMYDYFYQQWGSFTGIHGASSTLFENLQTFISSNGTVYQEAPNTYLDGSNPVLINFTTGWMSLAGLQGFERAYFFYILGTYISPHILSVQIAYDFEASPTQNSIIMPDNYAPAFGGDTLWGGSASYGGSSSIEQWRIFFNQQKVQSFQITIKELFDASKGTIPGGGLTLSGINVVAGVKSGYTKSLKPSKSVG